jgi:hypothetical protein
MIVVRCRRRREHAQSHNIRDERCRMLVLLLEIRPRPRMTWSLRCFNLALCGFGSTFI